MKFIGRGVVTPHNGLPFRDRAKKEFEVEVKKKLKLKKKPIERRKKGKQIGNQSEKERIE